MTYKDAIPEIAEIYAEKGYITERDISLTMIKLSIPMKEVDSLLDVLNKFSLDIREKDTSVVRKKDSYIKTASDVSLENDIPNKAVDSENSGSLTIAEKRTDDAIMQAIKMLDNPSLADIWHIIGEHNYTIIKCKYFECLVEIGGVDQGKQYYKDFTQLVIQCIISLLKYKTVTTDADKETVRNSAFDAIKEVMNKIGVKYAVIDDTVIILSDRVYTYLQEKGDELSVSAYMQGCLKEIIDHCTAANTIALADAARNEREAKKEAKRIKRREAKAAKNKVTYDIISDKLQQTNHSLSTGYIPDLLYFKTSNCRGIGRMLNKSQFILYADAVLSDSVSNNSHNVI